MKSSPIGNFVRATWALPWLIAAGLLVSGLLLLTQPWVAPGLAWLYLFKTHDSLWFLMAFGLVAIVNGKTLRVPVGPIVGVPELPRFSHAFGLISALAVLLIAVAGTRFVFLEFGLSLDEFMVQFQAEIFQGGKLIAPLADQWAEFSRALQPIFMYRDEARMVWGPRYVPVNGLIRAAFSQVDLGAYAAAFMAAGTVLLIARLAKALTPDDVSAPVVAIMLLAGSSQFLVTAMTPYAMTAHLFFNLLWLLLFLGGRFWQHALAVLVGVLAIGLHQVYVFPVFCAPFLVGALFSPRWKVAILHGTVYALAILGWVFWRDLAASSSSPFAANTPLAPRETEYFVARIVALLGNHSSAEVGVWMVNLLRFFAWQHLLLIPLIIVALVRWRSASAIHKQLFVGAFIMLIPHVLLMPTQGHGWGYRYLHSVLGNVVLVATFGWVTIRSSARGRLWRKRVDEVFVAYTLVMLCVALPLRAVQARETVVPYAEASLLIKSQTADVVLVDGDGAWYAQDLVRNDPFLRSTPRVMLFQALTPDQLSTLCSRYSVALVSAAELVPLGIDNLYSDMQAAISHQAEIESALEDSSCHLRNSRGSYMGPSASRYSSKSDCLCNGYSSNTAFTRSAECRRISTIIRRGA